MKYLLTIFLLINSAYASVTGASEGCPEKAQLIANEGEKFVIVRRAGKDNRLESVSGKPFSLQGKEPVIFRTNDKNHKLGDVSLEFEMTSVVMSSLPRLTVSYSGVQNKCRVNIYGNENKQN